jgi:hypothetical protein
VYDFEYEDFPRGRKFGEVVLCDFYLRKNRVSDGLESAQIGLRGFQLGGDRRIMKMNRGTAKFTD